MPHEPLVTVRGLAKRWTRRGGRRPVQALDGVDLEIARGTTLALAGVSGCGKTTLALCLAGLEQPDAGEIVRRGHAQLVFQDAAGSLNPRMSAVDLVAEPLVVHRRPDARSRALELIDQVGLPPHRAGALPHQFSGGQRQRLALARALALKPALLILDETLSGLDLSVQAQILNLLFDLQRARGLTYLFITHDLALAARIADEIAIMHAGRILERGAPAQILTAGRHPHTRALAAAIPELPCAG